MLSEPQQNSSHQGPGVWVSAHKGPILLTSEIFYPLCGIKINRSEKDSSSGIFRDGHCGSGAQAASYSPSAFPVSTFITNTYVIIITASDFDESIYHICVRDDY